MASTITIIVRWIEMPFDINNPPEKIRKLSDKLQRQWIYVFNNCWDGDPDEKKCHMQAWGVVKKSRGASEEEDDESFMDVGMAMGCGCTQMGDCGCTHQNSMLPTASECIVREIRNATKDVEDALRCRRLSG